MLTLEISVVEHRLGITAVARLPLTGEQRAIVGPCPTCQRLQRDACCDPCASSQFVFAPLCDSSHRVTSAIVVIRNPFEAMWSEVQRMMAVAANRNGATSANGHVAGVTDIEAMDMQKFHDRIHNRMRCVFVSSVRVALRCCVAQPHRPYCSWTRNQIKTVRCCRHLVDMWGWYALLNQNNHFELMFVDYFDLVQPSTCVSALHLLRAAVRDHSALLRPTTHMTLCVFDCLGSRGTVLERMLNWLLQTPSGGNVSISEREVLCAVAYAEQVHRQTSSSHGTAASKSAGHAKGETLRKLFPPAYARQLWDEGLGEVRLFWPFISAVR